MRISIEEFKEMIKIVSGTAKIVPDRFDGKGHIDILAETKI